MFTASKHGVTAHIHAVREDGAVNHNRSKETGAGLMRAALGKREDARSRYLGTKLRAARSVVLPISAAFPGWLIPSGRSWPLSPRGVRPGAGRRAAEFPRPGAPGVSPDIQPAGGQTQCPGAVK